MLQPHGINFHHFYNHVHPKVQGAISAQDLRDIIDFYGPKNIFPAKEWLYLATQNKLQANQFCITFDDGLLSQYEIALPVLQEYGLTAFWFVCSSMLLGEPEKLEIYRYFRTVEFADVDDFYQVFKRELVSSLNLDLDAKLAYFNPKRYLHNAHYYSDHDREFRYIRDQLLTPAEYDYVMENLLLAYKFNPEQISDLLWLKKSHLIALHQQGHVIGLHSHNHPTQMEKLSIIEQHYEYYQNHQILTELIAAPITSMSHPCNSYSLDTLDILDNLNIALGFRSDMGLVEGCQYEYPREDHANIMRELHENKRINR